MAAATKKTAETKISKVQPTAKKTAEPAAPAEQPVAAAKSDSQPAVDVETVQALASYRPDA
jgi:hypothetical protein